MNEQRSISNLNRAERAHGSRWLAALFAMIAVVAGSFAGCTDVIVDPPSCGTCPRPEATYDTVFTVDSKPDTLYERETITYLVVRIVDTLVINNDTKVGVHHRDTIVDRHVVARTPIRKATIVIKDRKSGELRSKEILVRAMDIQMTVDENRNPRSISFDASVPIGSSFADGQLEREIGVLNIFMPESRFTVGGYKLDARPTRGPSASLIVGDKQLSTGGNMGSAYLEVSQPNVRQRTIEVAFRGTFLYPGTNTSDTINVSVQFRLSY